MRTGGSSTRYSPDVPRECETILRARLRASENLELLAIVQDSANFASTPAPDDQTIAYCEQITGYRKDAVGRMKQRCHRHSRRIECDFGETS